MSFRDIKGQDRAVSFLKGSIKSNKVAHAYLFTGPGGIGKKLTAVKFAKALNCLSRSGEKPCGACASCRKIDSNNHPDVFLATPEKEGASIKIEKMRELIKSMALKPYEAAFKVFIIDDAGSMTEEAQNAILKTLEEPPKDSVLILIAADQDSLLPTIASRAQNVRFFPFDIESLKNILVNNYEMDASRAHILANITCGRLGEALRYNGEDFFNKRIRVIKGLVNRTFFDSDFEGLSKSDFKLYLDIMLTYFRDILVAKASSDKTGLVNVDKAAEISAEAKQMKFDELDRVIKQLILTNSFLDRNVNMKLAMASLGLSLTVK